MQKRQRCDGRVEGHEAKRKKVFFPGRVWKRMCDGKDERQGSEAKRRSCPHRCCVSLFLFFHSAGRRSQSRASYSSISHDRLCHTHHVPLPLSNFQVQPQPSPGLPLPSLRVFLPLPSTMASARSLMRLGTGRPLTVASRTTRSSRALSSTPLRNAPKASTAPEPQNMRQAQRPRTSMELVLSLSKGLIEDY